MTDLTKLTTEEIKLLAEFFTSPSYSTIGKITSELVEKYKDLTFNKVPSKHVHLDYYFRGFEKGKVFGLLIFEQLKDLVESEVKRRRTIDKK